MKTDPPSLIHIAQAVLDGMSVDWDLLETTAGPAEKRIILQLKIIAGIASLQRRSAHVALTRWGHLRILARIGGGAFGEVYRAWDTRLEREVALKLLHPNRDPRSVLREARLLARVRHPNVVTVYDAAEVEERAGFWMELVEGRTVEEIIKEEGPYGPGEAVSLGITLCHALAAVHQAGLLHRDVKAQNVIRAADGRVVLMDFGTGWEIGENAALSQNLAGTPVYLAPEVFSGGDPSRAGDIYSLGVLLFHVVTGSYPVVGRNLEELRRAHQRRERRRILDLRPGFPSEAASVIERALDEDPGFRYAGADEMATALERAARRTARAGRRKVLWAGAAAVTVLALLALSPMTKSWRDSLRRMAGAGMPFLLESGSSPVARRIELPSYMLLGTVSADDRAVSYSDLEGNLAVRDLETGNDRIIVRKDDPHNFTYHSALSPDGSRIAFSRYLGECRCMDLEVVETDVGLPRLLVHDEQIDDLMFGQWSQDGQQLLALFSMKDGSRLMTLTSVSNGSVRVLKSSTDLSTAMALSPDGRYVVYQFPAGSTPPNSDLFILATDGSFDRPLLEGLANDAGATWTADGRRILFASDRTGGIGLWLLDVREGRAAGSPKILRKEMGRLLPGTLTRSGAYYYSLQAGMVDVYSAEVDFGARRVVRAPSPVFSKYLGSNMSPDWSPDGRFLAYVSLRQALGQGSRVLAIHTTETAEERDLRIEVEGFMMPRWSPDGRSILVRGSRRNSEGLHILDSQTGAVFDSLPGNFGAVEWDPDGRHLYYPLQKSIHRLEIQTGQRREIHTDTSLIQTWIALSSDGRWLGFSVQGDSWRLLKAVPAKGGAAHELARMAEPVPIHVVGWAAGGGFLVFTRLVKPGPDFEVWAVPFGGGEPFSLGLKMDRLREARLHPDGRTLAFTAGAPSLEFWVLQNFLPSE